MGTVSNSRRRSGARFSCVLTGQERLKATGGCSASTASACLLWLTPPLTLPLTPPLINITAKQSTIILSARGTLNQYNFFSILNNTPLADRTHSHEATYCHLQQRRRQTALSGVGALIVLTLSKQTGSGWLGLAATGHALLRVLQIRSTVSARYQHLPGQFYASKDTCFRRLWIQVWKNRIIDTFFCIWIFTGSGICFERYF